MYLFDDINRIKKKLHQYQIKLLLFDFDGTLAPLAPTPDKAQMSINTERILSQLEQKKNVFVGIVSGRQLKDIKEKVHLAGLFYVGNHGFEKEIFDEQVIYHLNKKTQRKLEEIKKKITELLRNYPNAWLEDKKFIITVHYRAVENELENNLKQDIEVLVKSFGDVFTILHGKKISEVQPREHINKGTVVEEIAEKVKKLTGHSPLVLYIGDDATDEDAFHVVKNYGITIHVEEDSDSIAEYFLHGTTDVYNFLTFLQSEL